MGRKLPQSQRSTTLIRDTSSSGAPYRTPKGHSPSWTAKVREPGKWSTCSSNILQQVDWQKGDALNPQTFAHIFPEVGGVVHTLGTLLEDGAYKQAVRAGDLPGLLKSVLGAGADSNPLRRNTAESKQGSYETLNRDSGSRFVT